MFSDKDKQLYSDEFYFASIQDMLNGSSIEFIDDVIRHLEEEEDYEACDGLKRAVDLFKKGNAMDVINELKKLREKYGTED